MLPCMPFQGCSFVVVLSVEWWSMVAGGWHSFPQQGAKELVDGVAGVEGTAIVSWAVCRVHFVH